MKEIRKTLPKLGSYVTLQSWMVKELDLHGDELLVYAIIYGFSQDGTSVYAGTTRYISWWLGKSKETILKILRSLRSKNLIARRKKPTSFAQPNRYYCDYWATITRYPAEAQQAILHNWADFSTSVFPPKSG